MPRDTRERLASLAITATFAGWMLLARPLGGFVVTIGLLVTAAVAMPAYARWCRGRSATGS